MKRKSRPARGQKRGFKKKRRTWQALAPGEGDVKTKKQTKGGWGKIPVT